MKKLLFLLLIGFFTYTANAQSDGDEHEAVQRAMLDYFDTTPKPWEANQMLRDLEINTEMQTLNSAVLAICRLSCLAAKTKCIDDPRASERACDTLMSILPEFHQALWMSKKYRYERKYHKEPTFRDMKSYLELYADGINAEFVNRLSRMRARQYRWN